METTKWTKLLANFLNIGFCEYGIYKSWGNHYHWLYENIKILSPCFVQTIPSVIYES